MIHSFSFNLTPDLILVTRWELETIPAVFRWESGIHPDQLTRSSRAVIHSHNENNLEFPINLDKIWKPTQHRQSWCIVQVCRVRMKHQVCVGTLSSLTSSQYEAFLFPLSAVGFYLLTTVEEGLNTGLSILYILAAPLTAVWKRDDMHSIQTAKTLNLIFVLTCWNDSQERTVKSLRPAERLQKIMITNTSDVQNLLRLVVTSMRVEARFFLPVDLVSHFHSGTKANDLQLFIANVGNLASKCWWDVVSFNSKTDPYRFFL